MQFRDRIDAGRRLATVLRRYRDPALTVLGIPRGGVVVASEVARALSAPLDAWVVRKVNAPRNQELRLGAVAEGGVAYLDEGQMHKVDIGAAEVAPIVDRRVDEVKRRARRFHRGGEPPALEGRTVVLVDDGIATGGTARAALRAIREHRPARLILAVPVASARALEALRPDVDEVVCLRVDPYLAPIGAYYLHFRKLTDEDVVALLERARGRALGAGARDTGTAPPGGGRRAEGGRAHHRRATRAGHAWQRGGRACSRPGS